MEDDVKEVMKILGSKKPSHVDVKFLFDKYRHIAFLRQLLDQEKRAIVYDLLASLRYQRVEQNDLIFMAGERSDKFYLIIKGSVRIFLADPAAEGLECPLPGFFEKHCDQKRLFPNRENRWLFKGVAALGDGQAFGELGILQDKPRLATVIAVGPTVFGVISADDFKRILEPTLMAETEEKLKFLRPLLDYECSYEEYWRLAAFFSKVTLAPFQTLYEEGQPFNRVFFVAHGLVRLEKMVGKSDYANAGKKENANLGGKKSMSGSLWVSSGWPEGLLRRRIVAKTNAQPLIEYGQNQFLGFKELLESHAVYCTSARVVEPGMAYSIDVDNIRRCFTEFTSFKRAFYGTTIKKDIYVKKKLFFPQGGDAGELDSAKSMFQAKTRKVPDYRALEREVVLRRGPITQKEDPNYLFSRLNEGNKIKIASKRQHLQSLVRKRTVRFKPPELQVAAALLQTGFSRFRTQDTNTRRDQSAALSAIYLNNHVFQPQYHMRDSSLNLVKRMTLHKVSFS